MSSVLKLQSIEATASTNSAAVVSLTSSGSRCCGADEEKPPSGQ
ncbi:class III lanthipeptide [Streptomyces sp. NPDC101160]